MHACKQYICWSFIKSTFNTVHFDRNPFTCPCEEEHTKKRKKKKKSNYFKFGTFIGRFPSDGAASMAEKGLRDSEHALYREFQRLAHGRRFRSLAHRTNRTGNSFVPTAVRLLRRSHYESKSVAHLKAGRAAAGLRSISGSGSRVSSWTEEHVRQWEPGFQLD